jgi:hypothetical protein
VSTLQLLILCVTLLFALLIVYWGVLPARSEDEAEPTYDPFLPDKATVVVSTLDRRSVQGVVIHSTPEYVSLGGAAYTESGTEVKMSGVVRVPRTNIALVQDVSTLPLNADNDH